MVIQSFLLTRYSVDSDHLNSESNAHTDSIIPPFTSEENANSTDTVITTDTPTNSKERTPYQPYSLPCIKEALRFLTTLINPFDKRNSIQMLRIGLNLLKTVIENLPFNLESFPSLVKIIQDSLCKYLVFLLRHENLQIFAIILQNAYILFTSYRRFLKLQLEIFYTKLMEMVNNEKVFFGKKEVIMEYIVEILNVPNFARDIYLNYDCSLYRQNLFEDTSIFLANLANSQNGLTTLHLLACEAAVSISRTIVRQNNPSLKIQEVNSPNHLEYSTNSRNVTPEDAIKFRSMKKELLAGSKAFNLKPSEGIAYFISHKILTDPPEPMKAAVLLKKNPWLNKKSIGKDIPIRARDFGRGNPKKYSINRIDP